MAFATGPLLFHLWREYVKKNIYNQTMSVELNAVSNIIAGVKKTTGKGQAGVNKITKSYKKAVSDKARKEAFAKKKAEAAKRKTEGSKKTSSKPTTKPIVNSPSKPPVKKETAKPTKPIGSKEDSTFTPKPRSKVSQPSLPGMSKAKIKAL